VGSFCEKKADASCLVHTAIPGVEIPETAIPKDVVLEAGFTVQHQGFEVTGK
jgi:hypothetical protein